MIEVRKPSSIDKNDFHNVMAGINFNALKGIEGRNKGKADPHYIARWDEKIAPAPSKAAMLAQAGISIKRKAKKRIIAFAESIRAELIGDATPNEVMGWPAKAERARRSKKGTASQADTAAIAMEVVQRGRGETNAALVAIQLGKADLFAKAIGAIDGMQNKAVADILTTAPSDMETFLATLRTNALTLKAQILGG